MNSEQGGESELNLFSTRNWIVAFLLAFFLSTLGSSAAFARSAPKVGQQQYETRLNKKVYDRLVTVPWFGVFDNLAYKIHGTKVTLSGQVLFPVTRSSVKDAVKGLTGVTKIVDHVKQLPFTPFDNQIRWAEYRSIFGYEPLFRYSLGVNPNIHIIVNNSRVTLVGVVDSKADKELAGMRAKLVPYVFSVKNDLVVS